MNTFRRWSPLVGLAALLLLIPAAARANATAEIDSGWGTAAAILCGVYMVGLGPVAGIIAGLISSCGWLLFDAIFL